MEEESGYSRNSIINWETGIRVPRADTLTELAKLLGTTVSYLAGETEDHTIAARPMPESPKPSAEAAKGAATREDSPLVHLAMAFEILKYRDDSISKEEKIAILSLLDACKGELNKE